MTYKNAKVAEVAKKLTARVKKLDNKADILKATELKALYAEIPTLDPKDRAGFGQEINALKQDLQILVDAEQDKAEELPSIDVTAPFDVNSDKPQLLSADHGSQHPLTQELEKISDIFRRMGFVIEESRQIDDEYHMFDTLNFPPDHPARDDYDTFITTDGMVAPAHTSTMQNRYLKKYKDNLKNDQPIAVLVPDRVFRNEDLDARHEHTFYQTEGIFVDKGVHAGMLMATLQTFLSEYYGKDVEFKTQPFYFPFTEPSFEFALSCPFCDKAGCNVCSHEGWIELLGCGMIHPNVLKMAGIDPKVYTGFAWGCGVERLIMMKHNIEDVRHFHSGKLDFLRQF